MARLEIELSPSSLEHFHNLTPGLMRFQDEYTVAGFTINHLGPHKPGTCSEM